MKNIIEICTEQGIQIPEDKHAAIMKAVNDEGYITLGEHGKKIQRIEADRDSWKVRAETAETTLKSFDGVDIQQINAELESWKKKAHDVEQEYQAKVREREFNDALESAMKGYKFSSEAAKRAIMAQIRDEKLPMKDGEIIGLDDIISQIKESDKAAFVDEEQEELDSTRARFTQPRVNQNSGNPSGMTKRAIMDIKDRDERRKMIAQNMDLFSERNDQ